MPRAGPRPFSGAARPKKWTNRAGSVPCPPPPGSASAFASANPHALAAILEASETRRIIAATDIFDLAGTKLWARNQPVSAELQRKLLDRKLREPLEACLVAEDGATPASLAAAALAQRIDSDGGLAAAAPAGVHAAARGDAPAPAPGAHSCCCRRAGGTARELRPRGGGDGARRRAGWHATAARRRRSVWR